MSGAAVSTAGTGPGALRPDWPAPKNVRAVFTLRSGGVSIGACTSLNVATHVQDDPQAVAENRRRIAPPSHCRRSRFGWPRSMAPKWCASRRTAPAAFRRTAWSAAFPARCVPSRSPTAAGTVRGPRRFGGGCGPCRLARPCGRRPGEHRPGAGGGAGAAASGLDWPRHLGGHFEVGAEVRQAFVGAANAATAQAAAAFLPNIRRRWQCDLVALNPPAAGGPGGAGNTWRPVVYLRGCRQLLFPSPRWQFRTHGGLDLEGLGPHNMAR